jgi:TPR repeat protein
MESITCGVLVRTSTAQGDPDGANNLSSCFEHGHGIQQNIEPATQWYRFTADHNHPEGKVNYPRCFRLLSRWVVPDRSSRIADDPRLGDVGQLFIAGVDDNNSVSANRSMMM